jgi:hypothetical protein
MTPFVFSGLGVAHAALVSTPLRFPRPIGATIKNPAPAERYQRYNYCFADNVNELTLL